MVSRRSNEVAERSQAEAREILERRAKELARPLEKPVERGPTVELVTFACAGVAYGVRTADVVEIVPNPELTPVPSTPPAVLGVVNYRGRIVAVVDLGVLLTAGERADSAGAVLVVVQTGEAIFALRADVAPELLQVEEQDVTPASALGERQDRIIAGVTAAIVQVLDVEAVARDPRVVVHDEVG